MRARADMGGGGGAVAEGFEPYSAVLVSGPNPL